MIRYIGKSIPSKKRKKSSRSIETKTPRTAVSMNSIAAMKARTSRSTFHEARIPSGIRNVVSSTMKRLTPSTPTV